MKITDIKTYSPQIGTRNQCLVKVETDEGIHGWGEAGLSGRELAVEGMVRHFKEFLLGKDPMRRGALWQEMYRGQYFEGGRTITAAISAVDIALYDIAGKALGVPVYQLLGGRQRNSVPCFATMASGESAEVIAELEDLLSRGWNAFRIPTVGAKPDGEFDPRSSIDLSARLVQDARRAVGPRPVLGVDYHHRLTVPEAAWFCRRVEDAPLDFIEEPIRDESPEAYRTLRSLTTIPFAIGEEISSKWHFAPYLESGLTSFCRLDISNVGGFTEAMKVAGWAEAHYVDLMPHNPLGPVCTAATIQLAAAVPNFSWMEVPRSQIYGNVTLDDVFPERPRLEGPSFPVPAAPGLGIEINESQLSKPFVFWEPPRFHRADGSYTNW